MIGSLAVRYCLYCCTWATASSQCTRHFPVCSISTMYCLVDPGVQTSDHRNQRNNRRPLCPPKSKTFSSGSALTVRMNLLSPFAVTFSTQCAEKCLQFTVHSVNEFTYRYNNPFYNKKPVQRARKTARCAICQYPQSTLLIGTARSSVHGVIISQKMAWRHPSEAASFGNFPIQLTQNMLSLPYDEVYESISDGHFTFKTCHGTLSHS